MTEPRMSVLIDALGVGSLSETIALALADTYAGIEFEDPTFERGTMAIMAALLERAGRKVRQ